MPEVDLMNRLVTAMLETSENAKPMCDAVRKFLDDTAGYNLDPPGRVALAMAHVATTLTAVAPKPTVTGALVGTAAMEVRQTGDTRERFVHFAGLCWDALAAPLATVTPNGRAPALPGGAQKETTKLISDKFLAFIEGMEASGVREDLLLLVVFNAVIRLLVVGGLKHKQVKNLVADSLDVIRRR